MRNPDNIMKINISDAKEEVYKIDCVPDFDIEDYDMTNPKDFKKFIESVERIVRMSFEYRQAIRFLRENMNMNACSLLEHVSNVDNFKVKIHIHHEPITLYDVVMAVYNKRCAMREPITEDLVAKEVMYQHYMLRVGLIPLSETAHELVHNQYLFIPTTAVFGKYWAFVALYHDYIEPETLETLKKIEEISKTYTIEQAKEILDLHLIHIDTSNEFGEVDMDEVKTALNERIEEIKKAYSEKGV